MQVTSQFLTRGVSSRDTPPLHAKWPTPFVFPNKTVITDGEKWLQEERVTSVWFVSLVFFFVSFGKRLTKMTMEKLEKCTGIPKASPHVPGGGNATTGEGYIQTSPRITHGLI